MEDLTLLPLSAGTKVKYLPGRQRQVFDLLTLFQSSQIIGLFGENGTGKSTLIQKGLIPELEKGFLGIGGRKWKTATIRPGITPLENLSASFPKLKDQNYKQKLEDEYLLTSRMKSNNDGLRLAALQFLNENEGNNYLLVIDNFEDLFHFKDTVINPEEWKNNSNSFIQNITKCASYSDVPIYFLIILRSDFVPNIFDYRNFHEILSKSQYSIPQLKRTEFQEVVVSLLASYNKLISNEAINLLYSKIGKDLKNLKILKLCLEKFVEPTNNGFIKEINTEILQEVEFNSLYTEKLESFYNSCTEAERILIEKVFKQITISQEGSNQRKPIRIETLLKVIGVEFSELKPILLKIQNKIDFVLEIIFPFQERLETGDLSFLSENAVINIKNEQFIPHWPRLVEWIKQEKESQEIYKRLSETAKLFDQDLTGYLRPPDLDFTLTWYHDQKPDELWASQFNGNYRKAIDYLLESKNKHEQELVKKENLQKQKIKSLRKTGIYIAITTFIIILVIAGFALDAKKQEAIATLAKEKAVRETEKAKIETERADILYNEAQNAMQAAQTSEKLALFEKGRADDEFKKAVFLRKEAETQQQKIEKAFLSLDLKSAELGKTVEELKVSDSLKGIATEEAQSARAYQEALNRILSLRNKLQKENYQQEEMNLLLQEVKSAYQSYTLSSLAFKGLVLPNNDLYQVLMEVRKDLIMAKMIDSPSNDLSSLPNGLRKISISSSGILAAGGDDGILLYSKEPFGILPLEFKSFKLNNDRIRSLEFINQTELVIGTVNGMIYLLKATAEKLEPILTGSKSTEIIEQLIHTEEGVFVLRGGEILKINLKDGNKVSRVPEIKATRIFKFNNNKLLVSRQNLELVILDISTLQWKTINSDITKKQITASINSGGNIFFGMENGDVYVCQSMISGNEIKIKTKFVIPAHLSRITSLDYDSKTQKLFTASLDQKANIFDLSLINLGENYITNHLIKIEGFNKWIWDFGMVINGKEKIILTVDENGGLKSWQTGTEMLYNELFQNKKYTLK
jgi:WD40 repeat protein/energy-coupling factor transporter ATP-binding protein EcfA2